MSKLWLIIGREYLSRVKKKTFILTTIFAPIGFVISWVALIFIMSSGQDTQKVALLDPSNILEIKEKGKLRDGLVMYKYPQKKLEILKESFEKDGYKGIVFVPEQSLDSMTTNFKVEYYSNESLGINVEKNIKEGIEQRIKKLKMRQLEVDELTLKRLKTDINVIPTNMKSSDEEVSIYRARIATVLGGIMMILIYSVIFIYGNMVMRSVMEEKTNRIVEVLISSVKPFQLMLGKIIGVGAVGLTQFAIWAITLPLLYLGVGLLFAGKLQELQESMTTSTASPVGDTTEIMAIWQELQNFDYAYIIVVFLVFFLAGYLLYASLFAAVGAAMGDDWGEGQSLMLVISVPIIIALYIGSAVVQNPTSSLGVWASMFPFFAPVVMPVRVVFDPPIYQVVISSVILVLTGIFFTWVSGRIYRIGILMYGKKTTVKDFMKWMFRKD
ncbi:ABC transporter permease [Aureispira sp. CCB-QB1]|uniref:ABC transporter permease n=1 Tax=Aureispira sp. CCB-QB1 TaxID=1313421 RepID=UPI00069846C9|nr:ABC transporter permease [Aureispira sp. CCB-QB1]